MYKEYDRISTTDNQLGTIKYFGKLPDHIWGANIIALGIEWDQPERGKNNGVLEGKTYFRTQVEGAGSFIKLNNKKIVKERYSFIEALIRQYSSDIEFEDNITFGSKIAQGYGFEKLNEIQSDFNNLTSVSLEKKNIYKPFDDIRKADEVLSSLTNVRSLDLSFNLVNDLKSVWGIVDKLPHLTTLNLNGNRFFKLFLGKSSKPHLSLKTLKVASTLIELSQVSEIILPKFPNLQEISLSGNRYTDDIFSNFVLDHPNLEIIDLSFNKLEKVPNFISKSSLVKVDLSDNQINKFPIQIFDKISSLDIRNNNIRDWATIDNMYIIFPNLIELRINGNPVFDQLSVEEMTINLIARFECQGLKENFSSYKVRKLNGSLILDDEIKNAELYFISKVKQGELSYDTTSKRWKKLIEKYSIANSHISSTNKFKNKLGQKKINLILNLEHESYKRIFLIDNSILKLKGIISRMINRSILEFKVYYYINEFEEGTELKIKSYLDDDLAIIDNFGFHPGHHLYISFD